MGDMDLSAARARIDAVGQRLAAMQDAGTDVAALQAQLTFAHHALREGRRADVEAICDEVTAAARRIDELGRTPARPPAAPVVPAPAAVPDERLAAIERRLEVIAGHAADAAAVAGRLHALDQRLAAVEARPAAPAESLAAAVRQVVDEVVPRHASELLHEAVSKLPTRDDLHQIAETLRADLDWRLEKAAAEHGWCSLSDVQSTVRKSLAEQEPGQAGGSQLGRLELALAEFVQQSKDQQERLIAALADRVAQHTKSLTKRMLVRDALPHRVHETEELAPSASAPPGEGSSRIAAITSASREADQPSKSPTELSLDPLPPEAIEASRRDHGSTTLFTKRVAPAAQVDAPVPAAPVAGQGSGSSAALPVTAPPHTDALHELVTAEVERALGNACASTMTSTPDCGEGSSSAALPTPATLPAADNASFDARVTAEVARQLASIRPTAAPPAEADLVRALVQALPQALQDETVRTELFAVLALEAAGKPGVLGELTGLRRYLKRELQAAAEQLAAAPVTAP